MISLLDRMVVFGYHVRTSKYSRTYGGAMKTLTPTELRANIYQLLDEVLNTGVPLEIKKGDRKLRIIPVEKVDKFQNLVPRPGVIAGDPEELVQIRWENEVNLDLP
jgi:prevent-host-death family protein